MRHRSDHARLAVGRVEVRRLSHAELDAGVVHGAIDWRPALRLVALDDDRPVAAVDRIVAKIDVVLDRDEQRQHIRPRPALVSHRGPAIEIERRAARCDRRVDHRCAADQASARHSQAASAQCAGAVGIGEIPVELRNPGRAAPMVLAAESKERRHGFLLREIGAGLEQQDFTRGIFGQTRRDNAPARARADNDDIIVVHGTSPTRASRRGFGFCVFKETSQKSSRSAWVIRGDLTLISAGRASPPGFRANATTSRPPRHYPCCRP